MIMKKSQTFFLSQILMLISFCILGQTKNSTLPQHNIWPRPIIVPIPEYTANVKDPSILLNGTWLITTTPKGEFWNEKVDSTKWDEVLVPGQVDMQGVDIRREQAYAYKKEFMVPTDYSGKRTILRFEGVSGSSRAWINGKFLRKHHGGYNVWTCDITEHVNAGKTSTLTLEIVEDPSDKMTSPFDIGGILRNVILMAVPPDYLIRSHIETDLDTEYKDAILKVWCGMAFNKNKRSKVRLVLKDPSGIEVPISLNEIELTSQKPENSYNIPVKNPLKWDAEHPNLYTLTLSIMDGKNVMEVLERKIGFREIEVEGKNVLVNGNKIKLRGVNRWDADPDFGVYVSDEKYWEEVELIKGANVNFVRISVNPGARAFLDACDSLGLYVLSENSVSFARSTRDDTAFTSHYMNLMSEMIEEVRSNPSVILYGLANETYYGLNISKIYEYTKAEDPTRPVLYSWSQTVSDSVALPYEVFSVHYADWNTDLGAAAVADFNWPAVRDLPQNMPVLHDEFAHGISYSQPSLARDPGIRIFWGVSLKMFWDRMFETEGCLGGATWAFIDHNKKGSWNYEYGAIDLWRRKRPEYWHYIKAYSPIRISDKTLVNPGAGNPIRLNVSNWYDHTNLNEIFVRWKIGKQSGQMKGPDIDPHEKGLLLLPERSWQNNEEVELTFTDNYGRLVDKYLLKIAPDEYNVQEPNGPCPEIIEDQDQIVVSGRDFEIAFSKQDGLIKDGKYRNQTIITDGPFFQLTGAIDPIASWKLESISASKGTKEAIVKIKGTNSPVKLEFEVRIDGTGLITTNYTIHEFGVASPAPAKIPWDEQDGGGFEEVGISYVLTDGIDHLKWDRNGLWSCYPPNNIGRNKGVAARSIDAPLKAYKAVPTRDWSEEEKDYSVFGKYDLGERGTNDFRSMKGNINYALAFDSRNTVGIKAESKGIDAVRLEVQKDRRDFLTSHNEELKFEGKWERDSTLYFGSEAMVSASEGSYVEFSFTGTGFAWLGTRDKGFSLADVYIDDILVSEKLEFYARVNAPNSVLYSKEGLEDSLHTVRIVARKDPRSYEANDKAVISFGAIKLLDTDSKRPIKLIINNQWNYTKLGLGNYMKPPIYIENGYTNKVQMRMVYNEY